MRKKIITKPKSNLGLNKDIKICYNCMFYNSEGICPWNSENKKEVKFDYNHQCNKQKLFRYNLDYKKYI